ncbi:unnamed protein product [Acanthoscelides obtectus]|uniref:Regulatory protein zeste n=1 Tax=Acanthoscelides obtectus TaxID=200917 RepID=A0A9P0KMW2_ACAOB|nr:unnamed protein product [Acanthoscelides obtectus]CAK1654671.1 hypothetical protein AOBTE_LOCUS18757 [Acanthoscelides obtectus]
MLLGGLVKMDIIVQKRKRSANFNSDDKIMLLSLIGNNSIILNKKTDGSTNQMKEEAWLKIGQQFNSRAGERREVESLKKIWAKLKSDAKTYRAKERISVSQTRGGPSEVKADPILEKVLDILGRAGRGLENINDCDIEEGKENMVPENASLDLQDNIVVEEEEEQEHQIQPQIIDKTPVHQRRRPLISIERGSSLNEARCLTERKKQELIDTEMRREMELHELKKRKLFYLCKCCVIQSMPILHL